MPNVGVRDYLSKLVGANNVGYNDKTKGVTVNVGGSTYDLGNAGLTLGDDSRYYAPSTDMLNQLLTSKTGIVPLRDGLQSSGDTVDWIDGENGSPGQLITGGKKYNTNTGEYVNINGNLYTTQDKLNSLKTPTYSGQYDDKIQGTLKKLMNNKFSYTPENDKSLLQAQKQSMRTVGEEMNDRGILDSSITADYTQRAAQELIPQYEQMAYGRYQNEQSNYYNLLNSLSNLSSQDLQVWQANQTQQYNNNMLTMNAKAQALNEQKYKYEKAVENTNRSGEVSNADAIILGVEPGTLSQSKREMIEQEQMSIAAEQRQLEQNKEMIAYENDMANKAYETKLDIDFKKQLEYGPAIGEMDNKIYSDKLDTDYQQQIEYGPYLGDIENTTYGGKLDIDYSKELEYGPAIARMEYENSRKYPKATSTSAKKKVSLIGDEPEGEVDPITNKNGDDWVLVPGLGNLSYAKLEEYVNSGKVREVLNSNGTHTYFLSPTGLGDGTSILPKINVK